MIKTVTNQIMILPKLILISSTIIP